MHGVKVEMFPEFCVFTGSIVHNNRKQQTISHDRACAKREMKIFYHKHVHTLTANLLGNIGCKTVSSSSLKHFAILIELDAHIKRA